MFKDRFFEICREHGLTLSEEILVNLEKYYNLLVETNKVMNLTGITEINEVYEKHFYDSLLPFFDIDLNNKNLVDVGTGAGFPGLVLAICFPSLNVSLVEPLTKRCNFLNKVINELSLNNVVVNNIRSEDFVKSKRGYYDYATARAVSRLNILLEIIMPLLKVDGMFIAMKSRLALEELAEADSAIKLLNCKVEKVDKVSLISNNEERINLYIRLIKQISNKYPRAYAQIKKKPL